MSVECVCSNPSCRKRYSVSAAVVGKSVKCKACGETFIAASSKTQADDILEPAWGDAKPAAPATTATVPTAIGRFAIRGKLGAGAFGTVYRAYDPQLDRVVALKVPNPGVMTDPKRAERFLREAKAAANLHHPHIVPVFDAGKDGDSLYIASAFIGGQPLADSIPESGTDFARAARLVRELAEALAYAHEQGIVHRDVKPANVMLDTLDRVHLMDFGLASRQEEAGRLTNDGAVMGTPAYMSPEQARGQHGDAQPATDQYAAGVVLYELLTGRTPFGGPPAAVIAAVLTTDPDPPRKVRPDVPKDLETICLKAMSKHPEDRYPTCRELADDLRRWSEGEPITARRMSLAERGVRWVQKEPRLAGAVALVATVFVASFILVTALARRADAARREALPALAQAEQDLVAMRGSEKRAQESLSDARAAERRAVDALAGAFDETEAARAREARARSEAHNAVSAAAQDKQQIAALQAALLKEQNKPDTASEEIQQRIVALEARLPKFRLEPLLVLKSPVSPCSASFSTNGSRIVLGSTGGTVQVWDAKTGAETVTLKGPKGGVYAAAFSPNGERVITGGHDAVLTSDAKTGAAISTFQMPRPRIYAVALSPDGTRAVAEDQDRTAKVWDTKTGAELATLKAYERPIHAAAFNADGSRIVAGSSVRTAKVWDAKTGAEIATLKGHDTEVCAVSFSRGGSFIVTGSNDMSAKVWDAKTGAEIVTLKGHRGAVYAVGFSTDGSRVVTGSHDATAKVWDAKTGAELFTILGHTDSVRAVAFSTDGSRILTAGNDGTARVWDAKMTEPPKP